jgi:hypothetical protein
MQYISTRSSTAVAGTATALCVNPAPHDTPAAHHNTNPGPRNLNPGSLTKNHKPTHEAQGQLLHHI